MPSVIKGDSNVNLDFSTGGRITGDFSNATIANRVMFQTSTANNPTSVSTIPSGTNTQSDFFAFNAADPNNASLLLMRAGTAETTLRSGITGTGTYLPMTFYTGGSERMRVTSDGNVGIGTSSPGARLQVTDGNFSQLYLNSTTTVSGVRFGNTGSTNGYIYYDNGANLTFQTNGAERARIDSSGTAMFNCTGQLIRGGETFRVNGGTGIASFSSNVNGPVIAIKNNYAVSTYQIAFNNNTQECGTITTGSNTVGYNSNSDYRLKENIQPMVGALAKVALLKPVTYQWKADGSDGQGFIAHELQEVVPEAVTGEKDGVDEDGNPRYQGIDTSFLVATLTAAIQEQQAIINDLTARIAALEVQP